MNGILPLFERAGYASVKRFDVNNDGKLGYIDDYIMTAIILLAQTKTRFPLNEHRTR